MGVRECQALTVSWVVAVVLNQQQLPALGKQPRYQCLIGIRLLRCADVRGSCVLVVANVRSSGLQRGNEPARLLNRHRFVSVSVKDYRTPSSNVEDMCRESPFRYR